MYGIISELPEPYFQIVEDIWDKLEKDCGLTGIRMAPIPHFSWHVSRKYDFDKTEEILHSLAAESKSFRVRTSGIGLFSGQNPVVYVPVVRTAAVNEFHEKVWDKIEVEERDQINYYVAEKWMPHIALAYPDVNKDNLDCAMQSLAFGDYDWHFNINSISLMGGLDNQVAERIFKLEFGK